MTKPNDNPLAWVDRLQALADAYPDAEYEVAGGLLGGRIALPVSALTPYEIELILKATPTPQDPDAS